MDRLGEQRLSKAPLLIKPRIGEAEPALLTKIARRGSLQFPGLEGSWVKITLAPVVPIEEVKRQVEERYWIKLREKTAANWEEDQPMW